MRLGFIHGRTAAIREELLLWENWQFRARNVVKVIG